MALGFLPIDHVQNSYDNARHAEETILLINHYPALEAFFDYFERTWMNNHGVFPPVIWNVFDRPMEFRTNNHVESFHNR